MKIFRRLRRAWNALRGRAEFKAAEVNRLLMDFVARSLSADDEIKGDIRKIRARARDLARNEGYGKQYLRLLTVNVIGPTGIRLQVRFRNDAGELDREVNKEIERGWKLWAKGKVTVDNRHNLRQFENILVRALARDGEIFVRKYFAFPDNPFGLALQAIDADLLDETFNRPRRGMTNEVRMGVEVNELGRPVGYWFSEKRAGATFDVGSAKRSFVPADEVIHVYESDRPNQTRGVSWLASTMVPMKMLGGYEEAELVAARTAAAKMGFFEKEPGAGAVTDPSDVEMEASPGTLEELPEGWKFSQWNPEHPTGAFADFVKGILRKIASALGVSYNGLANDLEGVNYSSLRSGLIIERDYYRTLQRDIVDTFLWPLYGDWLNMALLTGSISLPSMDFRFFVDAATWQPRGWAWVDPLKEVAGAEKAIGMGLTSRTRQAAERGEDIDEIFDDLAREQELAVEKGISITGSGGTEVVPNPDSDENQQGGNQGDRMIVQLRP